MIEIAEKYLSAYEKLNETIQKHVIQNRYPAMGYTSNLDLLCDFHVEILNNLLSEYLPDAKLSKMKPANRINNMEDLICTLVYFCSNGIGGEVDIENIEVVKKSFQWKNGMGGTSVQAAMALAAIGCPSIVHLTDDSGEVCKLLQSPYIYTVSEDEELVHTDVVIQKQKQEIHCIIQFKKGDKIRLPGQEMEIPVSNRLILTKMTVNEFLPFSKPYFSYVEKKAPNISSNVLSSFNALLDKNILLEHLEFVTQHIKKYKQTNQFGIVFFEDAHYHDYSVRCLCMETLYPYVDIVSLNEEELKYTLDMYGISIDISNIISCVEGMKFIKNKFRIQKGIIVHTKDYSIYVGSQINAVDIESGLIYGNLLATAKAENGWYGTREQLQKILDLPLSAKGMENLKIIADSEYADEATLVPTKYIDKPKYTIGLGDTFIAGVQMCF
jgi:ADP-dependent phosphofructokinase/glucokinase